MTIKRKRWMIAVFIAALLFMVGCEEKKPQETQTQVVLTTGFAEDEVFRIDKASCSLYEIRVYLINMQKQYESVYGPEIWKTNIDNTTLENKIKDTAIARIAQVKTMNLLATQYGVELSTKEQEMVKKASAEYVASLNQKEITYLHATEASIEKLYSEYALANKVYDYIIQDVNPEISDDEARTITVKQILIKTYSLDAKGQRVDFTESGYEQAKQLANEVYKRAANGEDFDSLVEAYNEDVNSTYSFGKGEMDEVFEEAAFNLGTDEISPVVETEYGFHILKCISTFDRKETDANKEKIAEKRKKEAFNKVYDDFVMSLTRNMNDDLWDSVELSKDEEIVTDTFFDVYNTYFK